MPRSVYLRHLCFLSLSRRFCLAPFGAFFVFVFHQGEGGFSDILFPYMNFPDFLFYRLSSRLQTVWNGIVGEFSEGSRIPLSPFASCHAFDLGLAEGVEPVYQRHTDVDFSGLTVRVT